MGHTSSTFLPGHGVWKRVVPFGSFRWEHPSRNHNSLEGWFRFIRWCSNSTKKSLEFCFSYLLFRGHTYFCFFTWKLANIQKKRHQVFWTNPIDITNHWNHGGWTGMRDDHLNGGFRLCARSSTRLSWFLNRCRIDDGDDDWIYLYPIHSRIPVFHQDSSIFSIGNPELLNLRLWLECWMGGRPNVCQWMKRQFVPVLKGILYVPGVAGSLLFGNVWWPANSHKPESAHFFTPASLEWTKKTFEPGTANSMEIVQNCLAKCGCGRSIMSIRSEVQCHFCPALSSSPPHAFLIAFLSRNLSWT